MSSTLGYKDNNADEYVNQFLACVKDCQRKYGGKTELATELDVCVANLCSVIETVFLHGLRTKPLIENEVSAMKHMSDIVTNKLLSNDNCLSFWPFLVNHLTKHECERFDNLKQIWTDSGKGKAWIRASLNEKSLERYFHIVLSNNRLLNSYYDKWAFLRDDEKNSMLPNMAAGLNSILFAISIDKTELNNNKRGNILFGEEPIINAPIRQIPKRKKRKVTKQIISFDDHDEYTVLSSSIPSSTSSGESLKYHDKTMDNLTETVVKEPKTSSTNSENNNPETESQTEYLTPSQHPEIGELRPISTSSTSDSNLEEIDSSTDISAVLTVVESQNREVVDQLNETITVLTRENKCLKDHLKQYIGAVQLLQRDDETELPESLQGLQIDSEMAAMVGVKEITGEGSTRVDYKHEAEVYERKLVQIAEMHAELIDFNGMLQQRIYEKNGELEAVKRDLVVARGDVDVDEAVNLAGKVHIWIPSAFLTGSGSDTHHVYQIFLRIGNDEWNIYRRYSQFYALHVDLKKLDPAICAYNFPPKKSIGKKDSALVEERRKRLQHYLRKIIAHWPEISECNNKYILEQQLSFFKEQTDCKEQTKKSIFSSKRNNGTTDHDRSSL